MKRIILMGRTGAGKTTLKQALKGEKIQYHKTQYTNFYNSVIDTPGEYAESKHLGRALALYSYEADIVGLLISATDEYSLIPPNVTCMANREVIGIVTQTNHPEAKPKRAEAWLRLAGCEKIFFVDSKSGEGIHDLIDYLQGNSEKAQDEATV